MGYLKHECQRKMCRECLILLDSAQTPIRVEHFQHLAESMPRNSDYVGYKNDLIQSVWFTIAVHKTIKGSDKHAVIKTVLCFCFVFFSNRS